MEREKKREREKKKKREKDPAPQGGHTPRGDPPRGVMPSPVGSEAAGRK